MEPAWDPQIEFLVLQLKEAMGLMGDWDPRGTRVGPRGTRRTHRSAI